MTPSFGQTIIEKETGDIGMVVELDTAGRTHRIRYRNGRDTWHYSDEIHGV